MKNFLLLFISFYVCTIVNAQVTNGLVAYYPLNGNVNDSTGNGNNGSVAGDITGSADRYGFLNAAAYFDGSTASVEVPRSIEDDFTVSFWFRTTQFGRNGSQWYNGQGLIDAEMCGETNDWGISLINGGKVCVGIGNPDVTLISDNDYNDGAWHHVAVRRSKTTSLVELFVDNALAASGNTGNTESLDAPPGLRFGNDYCDPGSSLFNGDLDDVKFYNRVLSDEEVGLLASTLPVVSIRNKRAFEGNDGTSVMKVKVSLSHAYNNTVKLDYRTADSTAIAPTDYIASSGTLRFGPGRTSKDISIVINGNTTSEKAKYFKIILSNAVNASLGDSVGIEKIKNDDTIIAGRQNVSENALIATPKIAIAPNPATSIINITGLPAEVSFIKIADMTGKILLQQKATAGKSTMNISGIKPGNYFVQFLINNKVQTLQLVKLP